MSAWRASLRELQNLCVYSAPMTATPGLRERKKRRTRESIAAAAHRLFVEHGYHATTLPDIAEAADVSTRTIFAYFPSKEDILFSGFAETIDDLAQALAHRPAGVQTLDVVRDFILSGQSTHNSELDAQLYVCITDDPTLRSHLRARIAQIEDYVAPAIADDLGLPLDDPRTQLVAAAFTAAFNLLADRGASKSRPYTPEELEAQIDPVIRFLRAGVDALKQAAPVA
jgi:AcrR family transcriptional regulator